MVKVLLVGIAAVGFAAWLLGSLMISLHIPVVYMTYVFIFPLFI